MSRGGGEVVVHAGDVRQAVHARASGADDPVDVGLLGDVAGDYHDFGFESDVTRSSKRLVEMSTAMTRPPSRATRDAVARPMPDAAPVPITVRPSNRPG
jgi:hypothetical protein